MAELFCGVDGTEPTLECWVKSHMAVEIQLYQDGSEVISQAAPLTDMEYDGTPESRKMIHSWMKASAMNPETPFGFAMGQKLPDGTPGILVRRGDKVHRDSHGKFSVVPRR